jgi:tuftelin-interacting protein 11
MTDSYLGSWEKHTKGIGSKLLQKFGFKGRLGANEDGMAKAIEVSMRPAGLGLGFGDRERKAEISVTAPKIKRKPTEQGQLQDRDGWKRTRFSKLHTQELTGKQLVEQIMLDTSTSAVDTIVGSGLIIDMRYKDVKVLRDLSEMQDEIEVEVDAEVEVEMKSVASFGRELNFNLELLEGRAGSELRQMAGAIRAQKAQDIRLQQQLEALHKAHTAEMQRLQTLEQLQHLAQELHQLLQRIPVPVEKAMDTLRNMQLCSSADFDTLGCSQLLSVVASRVLEQVREAVQREEEEAASTFQCNVHNVRNACRHMSSLWQEDEQALQIIRRCAEQAILPETRRFFQNFWQPETQCEQGVQAMEALRELLSDSTYSALAEGFILPRLLNDVQKVQLQEDSSTADVTGRLHLWILPWLSVLRSKLAVLYPEVRRMLVKTLKQQLQPLLTESEHESELNTSLFISIPACALALQRGVCLLEPWREVFDADSLEALLGRAVLPALVTALRHHVTINPAQQELSLLQAVLAWARVLPAELMACLLSAELLSAWLQVLLDWLAQLVLKRVDRQDGGEELQLAAWYEGWRALLPASCLQHDLVLEALNRALDMLQEYLALQQTATESAMQSEVVNFQFRQQRALDTRRRSQQDLFILLRQRKQSSNAQSRLQELRQKTSGRRYTNSSGQHSLKDILATLAEQHGLAFAPRHGKEVRGKQLWTLGTTALYLDEQLVFVQDLAKGDWSPMTIDDLLQRSVSSVTAAGR